MVSVHRTYDGKNNKGRMSTDMFHVIGITVDTSNWTQSDSNKVGKNSSIIESLLDIGYSTYDEEKSMVDYQKNKRKETLLLY